MVIAEKNVKGNVCCLVNNRQFNEVILSQMDSFFYYKKIYEETQVFNFKDLECFPETNI